jgi:hypothetical protein
MKIPRLILGMLAGNAAGALVLPLAVWMAGQTGSYMEVAIPSLLFIPFVIGLVAARVWKPLNLRVREIVFYSFACAAAGLGVAALFLREGIVCLLIVAPILFAGVMAGALLGRIWFRQNRDRLNLCLAPLLAVAIAAEPAWREPRESVVIDEIRVAAPPAKVWPHLLAFRPIPEPPRYLLFHAGLPYPSETTNGGDFVGADRACRFSGGAVFKEKIVEFEPLRRLTFDIVEMPRDPELMGHLDASRGQFELRDNGDGTTTLIGRTWYSLRVRPAWYFDWWTRDIFSAVHLRVMRNIQRLAETGP